MKIAVNTSGAITGGAVTHLLHVLPPLAERLGPGEELVLIGTADACEQLDPQRVSRWEVVGPQRFGLAKRALWERTQLPALLRRLDAAVLFNPSNLAIHGSPAPQVTLVHNLAPFLPALIEDESAWQKARLRLLRSLTGHALELARSTIFVSEWGKRRVLEHFPQALDPGPVIPFGADHAAAPVQSDALERLDLEDGRFLLSVSHFYRYKRLEDLVGAYVELGEAVRELPLVLAGAPFDPKVAEHIERMAEAACGRVLFTGSLPAADVYTLIRHCIGFVFTSSAENLPITLLEAMVLGAPIITNRCCSMPEVCGDAALYVEKLGSAAYAEALRQLLESPELRTGLRGRALARGREFSWAQTASRTLDVLRNSAAAAPEAAK